MTLRLLSAAEQLQQVEDMIKFFRSWGYAGPERMDALKTIAADLRGRLPRAPVGVVQDLEPHLHNVKRHGHGGFANSAKGELSDAIMRHWPTIRQALEFYENHVSKTS